MRTYRIYLVHVFNTSKDCIESGTLPTYGSYVVGLWRIPRLRFVFLNFTKGISFAGRRRRRHCQLRDKSDAVEKREPPRGAITVVCWLHRATSQGAETPVNTVKNCLRNTKELTVVIVSNPISTISVVSFRVDNRHINPDYIIKKKKKIVL